MMFQIDERFPRLWIKMNLKSHAGSLKQTTAHSKAVDAARLQRDKRTMKTGATRQKLTSL
jgi:hypothetical protein